MTEKSITQHVEVVRELMSRASLKGNEVRAYTDAWNLLASIIDGDVMLITTDQYNRLKSKSVAADSSKPEVEEGDFEEVSALAGM